MAGALKKGKDIFKLRLTTDNFSSRPPLSPSSRSNASSPLYLTPDLAFSSVGPSPATGFTMVSTPVSSGYFNWAMGMNHVKEESEHGSDESDVEMMM